MGEGKRRQYSRQHFLAENRYCAYCGAAATTTDHCPPRCFFKRRTWPETYEFPACEPCNDVSRLDEQALAVLVPEFPTHMSKLLDPQIQNGGNCFKEQQRTSLR